MRVIYILNAPTLTGGTSKKILDMIKISTNESHVYFISQGSLGSAFDRSLYEFKQAGAIVYNGTGQHLYNHIRCLARIVKEQQIGIIYAPSSHLIQVFLAAIIKLLRNKICLLVAFVGSCNVKWGVKRIILKLSLRKADYIVFISKYVKQVREKQYPVLKRKNSKIIYNGAYKREALSKLTEYERKILVCTSNFYASKNLQILPRVIRILVEEYDRRDLKLFILGEGPGRSELEKLIKEYSLEQYISLPGVTSDVGKYLDAAILYLHPAHDEGFGIAVAEAMLHGIPVIAANAGALPELIEDGVSGFLVPPYDISMWAKVIVTIMNDPLLRHEITKNALQRAKDKFTIDRFVKEHEIMYKMLLEKTL